MSTLTISMQILAALVGLAVFYFVALSAAFFWLGRLEAWRSHGKPRQEWFGPKLPIVDLETLIRDAQDRLK